MPIALGALGGVMLFFVKQALMPAPLDGQLIELGLAAVLGILLVQAGIGLRSRWWQRENKRHDIARHIDILPK